MLARQLIWRELGLEDEGKLDIASRCFYIGKGLEETKRFIKKGDCEEFEDLIGLTNLCGYKTEVHQMKEN